MSGLVVVKGQTIRAEWEDVRPVALAGMQLKFQASHYVVEGYVAHVRGDDPVNPQVVRLFVTPTLPTNAPRVRPAGCCCPEDHVMVEPRHVVAVREQAR